PVFIRSSSFFVLPIKPLRNSPVKRLPNGTLLKTLSPTIERRRMKSIGIGTCIALLIVGALWAQNITKTEKLSTGAASATLAIDRGAKWLASVQGADGGWGQDGGETSYIRTTERLESNGNDVANTAVAALALLEAGKQYQPNVDRALDFI